MSKPNTPSLESYGHAAWLLQCSTFALRAIAEVEAGPQGAFLPSGEPVILFERHVFHRLTAGKYDGIRLPGLTGLNAWLSHERPGGYGPVGVQHEKLAAAAVYDRPAALKSCSWGLFQILGENHAQAGYPELRRFINAMYRSAEDHLRALVMFLRHDTRLVDAIRAMDWPAFARIYNGPDYGSNQYDHRLLAAYVRLSRAIA